MVTLEKPKKSDTVQKKEHFDKIGAGGGEDSNSSSSRSMKRKERIDDDDN